MSVLLLARFKECPVIAVAAKPGGPEAPDTEEPHGVPELIEVKSPSIVTYVKREHQACAYIIQHCHMKGNQVHLVLSDYKNYSNSSQNSQRFK